MILTKFGDNNTHSSDDFNCLSLDDFSRLRKKYGEKLLRIDVPIIGVFGFGEGCGKMELTSKLLEEFISKGYKVKILSNETVQADYDSHTYSFPFNLFSESISDMIQIYGLNHMVYEICKKYEADIILIDIYKGFMPLCKEVQNEYGLLAFKICNALDIDVGFLNIYSDMDTKEFIEKLQDIFLYRFSIENLYFSICDKKIDWTNTRMKKKIRLMNAIESDIHRTIKKIGRRNVFSLHNADNFKRIINEIEDELRDNAVANAL